MYIPVLLVGTATDGPCGVAIRPNSWEEAQEMFGGYRTEVYSVPATGTSIVLTKSPTNNWQVYQRIGLSLYNNPLYSPSVSGNVLSFGSPGTSGTYVVQYEPIPEYCSLLMGLSTYLQTGAEMPWVWRVVGTKASVSIGDYTFTARYSGTWYNGISITNDGTTVTVTNPNSPKIPTVSYTLTTPNEFLTLFNYESARRIHPLELTGPAETSFSLPVGTWTLTGGTDGTLDEATVLELLASVDLGSIGLIVLSGGYASGVIDAAITYIEDRTESTVLVAGSPLEYKDWTSTTYQDYLKALPFSSHQLVYAAGWCYQSTPYSDYYYWDSSTSAFGGAWAKKSGSPVHTRTHLINQSPVWTAEELSDFTNIATLTRFIQTGVGFFRAPATSGRSPMITRVILDITHKLHDALNQYIGEPLLDITEVNTLVGQALAGLPNIREIYYECYLNNYSIIVKITVLVAGEVQTVAFDVVTKR